MCRNGAASARGATKAAEMLVEDGLRRQRRAPLTRRPWLTSILDRAPIIQMEISSSRAPWARENRDQKLLSAMATPPHSI